MRLSDAELRRVSSALDLVYEDEGIDARMVPWELATEGPGGNLVSPTVREVAEKIARASQRGPIEAWEEWVLRAAGRKRNPAPRNKPGRAYGGACDVCGGDIWEGDPAGEIYLGIGRGYGLSCARCIEESKTSHDLPYPHKVGKLVLEPFKGPRVKNPLLGVAVVPALATGILGGIGYEGIGRPIVRHAKKRLRNSDEATIQFLRRALALRDEDAARRIMARLPEEVIKHEKKRLWEQYRAGSEEAHEQGYIVGAFLADLYRFGQSGLYDPRRDPRARNPQDEDMRRLERAAAAGDPVAKARLERAQQRVAGTASSVESYKLPGEWNLILRKSRSSWETFLQTPRGGGGGGMTYRSVKAAIDGALKAVAWDKFPGKTKVWVIEAQWDPRATDYVVKKHPYWVDIAPYYRPTPPPPAPGSPEYWDRLTRNNPRRRSSTDPLTSVIGHKVTVETGTRSRPRLVTGIVRAIRSGYVVIETSTGGVLEVRKDAFRTDAFRQENSAAGRRERAEHPWLSAAQAERIARDHARRNPGYEVKTGTGIGVCRKCGDYERAKTLAQGRGLCPYCVAMDREAMDREEAAQRASNPGYSASARAFLSEKIPLLIREGYPQDQAVAIAISMAQRQGLKVPARVRRRNPLPFLTATAPLVMVGNPATWKAGDAALTVMRIPRGGPVPGYPIMSEGASVRVVQVVHHGRSGKQVAKPVSGGVTRLLVRSEEQGHPSFGVQYWVYEDVLAKPNPRRVVRRRRNDAGPAKGFELRLPSDRVKGTVSLSEAARRWPAQTKFAQAAFKDFHGGADLNDQVVILDDGSKDYTFLWTAGRSPEVTYGGDEDHVPDGSIKSDALYVHKTDEAGQNKPTYLMGVVPKKRSELRASTPVTRDFMLVGHMVAKKGWLRR